MKAFDTPEIRNVALAGHTHAGKTTLSEALLYRAKQTERIGRVEDGNTTSDYDAQEIKRTHSISASLLPLIINDQKVNLLDLPGRRDFVGELKNCLRVAEGVLLVLDASHGVEIGAEFHWEYSDEFGIPARAAFVNKLDKDQADFDGTVAAIGETFGRRAVALSIPVGLGDSFKGVIDLLKMKFVEEDGQKVSYSEIPAEVADAAAEARTKFVEAAAEGDEELMMKFLEDEPLEDEEIMAGLKAGVLAGDVIPVLAGSATASKGLAPLLDFITACFPNPAEGTGLAATKEGAEASDFIAVSGDGPSLLYVFKTVSDPYSGHLSFFKVMGGKGASESNLTNVNRSKSQRIAHVLHVIGKKHENVDAIAAGDLGAVGKLDATHTGDTLAADGAPELLFDPTPLPQPTVRMAIEAKDKADEEKIGAGFRRLTDQDPTLKLQRDPEIHQTIVSGMGDVHIDVAVAHLMDLNKVEVELSIPHVPYREAITKKAEGQGKYKKQSGGRGQYGDCWIRFEPTADVGDEFEFVWEIVGGVIPTKFEPSVKKGLEEVLAKGVLAGYPTLGIKASCYDGSFHDVDSSEMAFKVAASMAFKNVIPSCGPIILEPILKVTVHIPEAYMGDIMGDLNSKRGRILGVNADGKKQVIQALVPQSEMFTYSRELRSMTQGSGVFETEVDHMERVPGEVQDKIIADAHKEDGEE